MTRLSLWLTLFGPLMPLCGQMPAPDKRLVLVSPDPIELSLANGVGKVRVYFRKGEKAPLPAPPQVPAIPDSRGGILTGVTTTWIGPEPDREKAALVALDLAVTTPVPPLNAKSLLIFSWDDGGWQIPFTLKTQQPPVDAGSRLARISSEPVQMILVDGRGSIRIYFTKLAGYPMPKKVSITDAIDESAIIPAKRLAWQWIESAANTNQRGAATLELATIRGYSAPPVANARGRITFYWDDGDWPLEFSIKSQQPPVLGTQRLLSASTDAVQLPVLDDKGTVQLYFTKVAGYPLPKVSVSDAREADMIIPSSLITAKWEGPVPPTADRAVAKLVLSIVPGAKIPPVTKAGGTIFFQWPDQDWPLAFNIVSRAPRTFNLKTETFTVKYVRCIVPQIELRIENTGQIPITAIHVEGAPLEEASHGRKLQIASSDKTISSGGLPQNRIAVISVPLMQPDEAGSYQGSLYVSANESAPKTVGITLQSRGPNNWPVPPVLLFFTVLAAGYGLSWVLAQWFDLGGAQRAEALISLHQSRQDLMRLRDVVVNTVGVANMPATANNLDVSIADLDDLLRNSELAAVADLTGAKDRFASEAGLRRRLLVWIQWVRNNHAAQFANAAAQFDAVPLTDPNYDATLSHIATTLPAPPAMAGLAAAGGHGAAPPPPQDDAAAIRQLARQKKVMNWLQSIATLFAVFALAYITTFNNNPVFGSMVDYLQTLLYGLGLSTTGSQILTKARSTFARA